MRQKQIHNRSVVLTINKSWAGLRRGESGAVGNEKQVEKYIKPHAQ